MDKRIKSMFKEIINNRNLKENIPPFLTYMADKYFTAATIRLALHYFTLYEMYCDEGNQWGSLLLEYFDKVNKILAHIPAGDKQSEECNEHIKEVDEIRSGITERVDCLTIYTDFFEIYEYALNRVEYRFKEMEQLEDDEEIARKILRFIFDSDDNVIVNETIKEVIGQLPVRITRQKYFEYLKEGFSGLLGASEDIFESYVKIIRSSAMLDFAEDGKEIYPNLWEKKAFLEKLDFKNITREEYEKAIELISEAVSFLETETTAYYSLMELVNELYAILICTPYKTESSDEKEQEEAAFYIIKEINTAYFRGKQDEITEDLTERFKVLEGYQEEKEFDLLRLDDALFHLNENHRALAEKMSEDNMFASLLLSKNLLSDSLFIDIHKNKTGEKIGKERFKEELDRLIEDLTDKFQSCDRMIMRAIMANTINKIPVFFDSHSEVMDYVLYSLSKCTDMAEKYACIEIINELMDYQLI